MSPAWAEVVGAAFVRPGTSDDAVQGVTPAWVVQPGSVADVQACVRLAGAQGAALVPSGLGAHLDIGGPPRRCDVLLRLDRLARVIDHAAADMTVTVEAGCSLAALATRLAEAGQWLPLDPPRTAATTVGGLIAANLSGPLRASQGAVRDLLLGVRVVGADGAVVAGGGRVVKNVAGYDLPKLHVGALGTLGVLVEATFKVRPRPAREEALVISCRSLAQAVSIALAVVEGPVAPLWVEVGDDVEGAPGVVIGFGGIEAETAYGRRSVGDVAARMGGTVRVVADAPARRAECAHFPVRPAAVVLRAAMLPTRLAEVMTAVAASAGGTHHVRMMAHAANGVLRIACTAVDCVPRLVEEWRPVLERDGGALVVERSPTGRPGGLDPWGDPGPALTLMRRVKDAFDPASLLAPGRFVGGL